LVLVFAAAVAVTLASCGNKAANAEATEEPVVVEEVVVEEEIIAPADTLAVDGDEVAETNEVAAE
ncbi:MAG: hypothetical protein LUE93_00415, partial [Bacteroides sp.]|nr:hypothetical protein [Bacteroides sp.]